MTTHEDYNELDHLGRGFLEDLLPLMNTYEISGKSRFSDIVTRQANYYDEDDTPSEFLLIHTNEETIHTILDPTNYLSKYLSSFDLNHGLLLAIQCSIPHAAAAGEIGHIILSLLHPMDLSLALKGYAKADIWSHKQRRGKQPDYGWGPKRGPAGRADRPSVVLEVAYSEAEAKLQSDIRFWLSPKDGNVNACLTIRIDRSKPQIRVEQWRRDKEERIRRKQVVWITKSETTGNLTVTGDPLRLSFEDFFRRKPDLPREHDLEIPAEEFKELARTVWDDYSL